MHARSLLLRILIGCLVAAIAAAQTPMQLKVFRGTLVHSRVRTEMEVLEDYLIGINESNYGTVSQFIIIIFLVSRAIYSLCSIPIFFPIIGFVGLYPISDGHIQRNLVAVHVVLV